MRVFKPTYRNRQGVTQRTAKFYCEFRDHTETVRRLAGYTERRATEHLARQVARLVTLRHGREPLDLELARWVEALPDRTRDTLAAWGLLEARELVGSRTLAEHVAEFATALRARGRTANHARLTAQRARDLLAGCGFTSWTDIQAARVEAWLAEQRTAGLSGRSSNGYLQSVRQFCRWMVERGRAATDPLVTLRPVNQAADPRHVRRALSVDELRRLLDAAARGPERFGVSGPERALIYRLAVETGLRANELRSLTRASFTFGRVDATVTVEARSSKRRKRDELPLRADTAAALQSFLSGKHPGAPALRLPSKWDMAPMLRADLHAARAAWLAEATGAEDRAERERSDFLAERDALGRVIDFHALRHSFVSALARAGVHPRTAQQLARHSDVNLTLGVYTHVERGELHAALELLPALSSDALAATGTVDARGAERLALCLPSGAQKSCDSVGSLGTNDAPRSRRGATKKAQETQAIPVFPGPLNELRPAGFEPATYGLGNRCSIP